MKELVLQTKVKVCVYDEFSPLDKELVDAARAATANSYAVYSKFNVGAAVRLGNGVIVKGSNQENAAYPSGLCAERTTLFWANSQYPSEPVLTLAIAARTENGELEKPIPPCGACRQFLAEFSHDIEILCSKADGRYVSYKLSELLPHLFNF